MTQAAKKVIFGKTLFIFTKRWNSFKNKLHKLSALPLNVVVCVCCLLWQRTQTTSSMITSSIAPGTISLTQCWWGGYSSGRTRPSVAPGWAAMYPLWACGLMATCCSVYNVYLCVISPQWWTLPDPRVCPTTVNNKGFFLSQGFP